MNFGNVDLDGWQKIVIGAILTTIIWITATFITPADDEETLLKLVDGLPKGSRLVFNLYAIEGLGHKDIAQMLGISEGTSKSQLSRARELLKRALKENKLIE